MRLISRADTSLIGGLIASTFILFHRPLRSALDAARAIEGEYNLDLIPALVVLCTVFMYHQYRKRQQALVQATAAAEQARRHLVRATELEALVSFGQMLANALDLQGVRDAVIRGLPAFIGERAVWVFVKERNGWGVLVLDSTTEQETSRDDLEKVTLRALSVVDAGENASGEGVAIDSMLCFPLVIGSATIGMLGVHQGARPVGADARRAMGVAASALSVAVRNVQLLIETRDLSVHDSLTGCLIRKPGLALLDTELRRARRGNQPLSVLMIDVDDFKPVNDRYGHLCGDMVLGYIGRQLLRRLRSTDHKCRYGGDEFFVILPGTPPAGAERVADTLCRAIAAEPMDYNGTQIRTTVSIGVADVMPGELDLKAVMWRADRALYRAKEAGRNRWYRGSESAPDAGMGATAAEAAPCAEPAPDGAVGVL